MLCCFVLSFNFILRLVFNLSTLIGLLMWTAPLRQLVKTRGKPNGTDIPLQRVLYKFQLIINYINSPHNSSYTTIKTPNTTVLPTTSCQTHVKCTLYFGNWVTAEALGHKLCGLLYNEASEVNVASFHTVFLFQMHQCTTHCRQQILATRH